MGMIILGVLALLVVAGCWYALNNFEEIPSDGQVGTKTTIRRSLVASVIRACPECGAPGVDKDNKYVGEVCPTCGADRPPIEEKGEIWVKNL